MDIGGWKPDGSSQLLSMQHGAMDGIIPPEIFVGSHHISFFQRFTDPCRTDRYMIHVLFRNFFHLESIKGGIFFQVFEGSFAVFAETVVIADDKHPGSDPVHYHIADEL